MFLVQISFDHATAHIKQNLLNNHFSVTYWAEPK